MPLLSHSYVTVRSLENTELGLKQLQTAQKVSSKTKLLSWPDAPPQSLSYRIKIHYCPKTLAQLECSFQKLCKLLIHIIPHLKQSVLEALEVR